MSRSRRTGPRLAALLSVAVLIGCAPSVPGSVSPAAIPSSTAGAAATSIASPVPSAAVVPPVSWADCGGGFLCGTVLVPKDERDPSLGSLNVALDRLPATDRTVRIGSLVVNPGGPGGSSVEFVRDNGLAFPATIRRRFDLVGFDPRGVNASSEFRCIDDLDGRVALDPSPDTDAELTALANENRAYAEACGRRNDGTIAYLSTDAVVSDLERIRQALGDEGLTYLGFSYGTLIGSLYAERFPDRVRAMVLDGAMDPSLDLETFRADQARAFETSLSHFLA